MERLNKRVVRVTIYDFNKKEFIGNSTHVVASFNSKYKDIWKFNKPSDTGTNPIIFRSSDPRLYQDRDICIIFEFVIYCKQDSETVKELNCGWCRLPVKEALKKKGKVV